MESITVISLGTGREEDVTLGALRAMKAGDRLILRTEKCGAADLLRRERIPFGTLDDLYEEAEDFDELHRLGAQRILAAAEKEKVCFAVFDPARDGTVRLIRDRVDRVIPGVSAASAAADAVLPAGEVRFFAASDLDTVSSQGTLCLTEIDSRLLAGECKMKLAEMYAMDTPVWFFAQDEKRLPKPEAIVLEDLDRQKEAKYGHLCAAVIPERAVTDKKRHDFEDLKRVMDVLRAPGGCPWDREQTHRSLRNYLVEEAYETAAAVDAEEWDHVADELGDVLLQVVFQANIGREYGTFGLGDITTAITEKMIRRHRHIFGGDKCGDGEAVSKNWDRIKREERGFSTLSQTLRDLPAALPQLMRACKMQERAARSGADIPMEAALDALRALMDRLPLDDGAGREEREEVIGRMLMLCVLCARKTGADAETCLQSACERFVRRVEEAENAAGKAKDLTIDEMALYLK